MIAEPSAKRRYSATKMLLLFLYAALLFYMVVPLLMRTPFYQTIVLVPFPATEPEFTEGVTVDDIIAEPHWFPTSDGSQLFGWLFRRPGASKVIVFHHGNAGNIVHRLGIANTILNAGASVFLYDYRGYGKSKGVQSVSGLPEDGAAAIKYLTSDLKFAPIQIINYGESIGSGVACQLASSQPCCGLILEAPIASLPAVGRLHFPFLRPYPDWLFPNIRKNGMSTRPRLQPCQSSLPRWKRENSKIQTSPSREQAS